MAVTALLMLGCLLVSGLLEPVYVPNETHRLIGSALVIFVWLCTPFSIGVLFHTKISRTPGVAIIQGVGLLFSAAVSILAAITGYLGPSHGHNNVETLNRFVVLHEFVLPAVLAALFLAWFWYFPASRPSSAT